MDAVLNHVGGVAKAGVAGIYNRAAYAVPKRQALMRWGEHISAITGQNLSNVAVLAGAAVLLLVLRRGVVPTLVLAGLIGVVVALVGGSLPG